jgi:hypothetical protein
MIKLDSTEEERFQELKDEELTVVPWNPSIQIHMTSAEESTSSAYLRFAKELGINQMNFVLGGIEHPVHFSNKAIRESIHQMELQKAYLENLPKLFTVIQDVVQNSILLKVEEYTHKDRRQFHKIDGAYQYISAFCDEENIYPVHISAMKYKEQYRGSTNMYLVITVGVTSKKEVPPIRVHSHGGEESVCHRASSFDISLSQFVKTFNIKNGVLIKRLPDKMLTDEQRVLKAKILKNDAFREQKLNNIHKQIQSLVKEERYVRDSVYEDYTRLAESEELKDEEEDVER